MIWKLLLLAIILKGSIVVGDNDHISTPTTATLSPAGSAVPTSSASDSTALPDSSAFNSMTLNTILSSPPPPPSFSNPSDLIQQANHHTDSSILFSNSESQFPTSPVSDQNLIEKPAPPSRSNAEIVAEAIQDFYHPNATIYGYPSGCRIPNCHLSLSMTDYEFSIFYAGTTAMQLFELSKMENGSRSKTLLQCPGKSPRCIRMEEREGDRPGFGGFFNGNIVELNNQRNEFILFFDKAFFEYTEETKFYFRIPTVPHSEEMHLPEEPRVYFELVRANSSVTEDMKKMETNELKSMWNSEQEEKQKELMNVAKYGHLGMEQVNGTRMRIAGVDFPTMEPEM